MTRLFLILPFLLGISCGTTGFRSDGGTSRSPTKHYRACIVNKPDALGEPERHLVIECTHCHGKVYDQPLQRHAELVWSPDENRVAIIDAFASSENRIIIVRVPSGDREMEVSRDNARLLDSRSPSTQLYSHVYFSNVKWSDKQEFSATIDAYDPIWENVPESSTTGQFSFKLASGGI